MYYKRASSVFGKHLLPIFTPRSTVVSNSVTHCNPVPGGHNNTHLPALCKSNSLQKQPKKLISFFLTLFTWARNILFTCIKNTVLPFIQANSLKTLNHDSRAVVQRMLLACVSTEMTIITTSLKSKSELQMVFFRTAHM